MKKIIAAASLLFFVLIAALLPSAVRAEAPRDSYSGLSGTLSHYDEAYEAIRRGALDGEILINISLLGIREKDIVPLFTDVISSCPELFFINSTVTYSYNTFPPDHPVNSVSLSYRVQGRDLREARKDYESRVSYLAGLVDPDLTDAEKALFVHDFLISLYSYDTDLAVYDAYGMITGGSGVCRAYSLLYMDIMNRLGIDCAMVISDEMVHSWNVIKIDGKWYHADLTYDDPNPDRTGQVLHDYFLLSDEEIASAEKPHSGWRSAVSCSSSYPGTPFWEGIRTRMAYCSGYWYYFDPVTKDLMRTTRSEKAATVARQGHRWYTDQSRTVSWAGCFASPAEYGGYVLFNTPDAVMAYDPSTGTIRDLLSFGEDRQVIGITVFSGELYCMTAFNVNADNRKNIEKIPLSGLDPENLENPLPFSDVSSVNFYYDAILDVYRKGIFNGVSDTEFAPEGSLTRAMFVTVLGRLCGIDTEKYGTCVFSDVPAGEWYSPYVAWANECGLVTGTGNGRFSPSSPLTREQMYKIARSFIIYITSGAGAPIPDFGDVSLSGFPDHSSVSSWAEGSLLFCYGAGLMRDIQPGSPLRPGDPASRAEAAFVIYGISARLREFEATNNRPHIDN
ncbi:MAG: S-layer homology domain-containing protein [Clostridia bacterium]|nr:S-layer homology domain-containing protein [Clostridia bacterium]